jgi:hypothetical protein
VEGFTAYIQMIEQPHVLHTIRDSIVLLRDKVDKRIDVALDFHRRCTPAMVSYSDYHSRYVKLILFYSCDV